MELTRVDRDRIEARHAGLEQDALPGMPKSPKRKAPRAKPGSGPKAVWKRVKLVRPPRCPECIAEYEGGVVTLDGARHPVRPVTWERTANSKRLLMCHIHAEPWRAADKVKEPRRRRKNRR